MKKTLLFLLLACACEQAPVDIPIGEPSGLLTVPGARLWKLDQITDAYSISYDGAEPVNGTGFWDFNYYCQRPMNKLSDDYFRQTEGDDYVYELRHTFTYNDNFHIAHITQTEYEQTDHTDFFYDENYKWTGFEFTYADGSKFHPEIIQNAAGQVVSFTTESQRYVYTWKRDNLIRTDVYVQAAATASLTSQPSPMAIPQTRSMKMNFALKNYDRSHLSSLQMRSSFRSNAQTFGDWIKIETTEFTHFDHLLPDATTAAGWPSTTSEFGVATPVNDIKTWTTWEIDENGNKGTKIFELKFTLLKKMDDVPTIESYEQTGSYFDGEKIVHYTGTGLQKYSYQSGCKSPLQVVNH